MPRILVIEDNENNRDLISRYLALWDHEIVVAADGMSGLQQAQASREELDLVLLDMNLPDVDGWEVARQLKSNDATRFLPVIALTAHAMVGDREKALEAGCDDYASKPIDFKELLRKIETFSTKACAP